MGTSSDTDPQPKVGWAGTLGDTHELSRKSRAYGERVIRQDTWPIDAVNLSAITWETSTRAKRRHGYCSYDGDGEVTIIISEHTYENAGFDACRTVIRHELVHAWQYQHWGETRAVSGTDVDVETDHGESFRVWVPLLDLDGRCASYYTKEKDDYRYVYECPDCSTWFGNHRLCKSVRQAASGGEMRVGYCYCGNCKVRMYLRSGGWYLEHGIYSDDEIREFIDGGDDVYETYGIHPNIAPSKPIETHHLHE